MVSAFTLEKLGPQLVYCSVRDWKRFCYVIGFENIQIRFIVFHSGERIKKISGFAVEFAGFVCTEALYVKQKLLIKKFPDTCGWNFKLPRIKENI